MEIRGKNEYTHIILKYNEKCILTILFFLVCLRKFLKNDIIRKRKEIFTMNQDQGIYFFHQGTNY